MSSAISIPDDLTEEIDRLALRAQTSRAEVVSTALREYIALHTEEDEVSTFVGEAARRILSNTEW